MIPPVGLREYKKKRDFRQTSEPVGEERPSPGPQLRFVIQKHKARRLHYDLRLEMEGVLRSWAVPKGPSLDPADKRLAVQVEDHPIEYGDFEGVIPEGQYGAGQVIVWDQGAYEYFGTEENEVEAWKKGKLEFRLHGKKLKGIWLLIKTKGRGSNDWLFFKKSDKYADPERTIIDERPESVVSGKRVEQLERDSSAAWNVPVRRLLEELEVPRQEVKGKLTPMLATLVDDVPEGTNWVYEMKYDGIRAIAVKKKDHFELYSRNLNPLEKQFPEIVEALKKIPSNSFCLDGEIAALDPQGRPRFQLLQPRIHQTRPEVIRRLEQEVPVFYYAFDLIECEGYDLRGVALSERKKILKALLSDGDSIRYGESISGQGRRFFHLACESGLEGILAKEVTSTYESKRSRHWLKIKCLQQQEFVIGGYTPPSGTRKHFGALLLGLFEDGNLHYVGRTGSGFDAVTLKRVYKELKKRETDANPFKDFPKGIDVGSWVKPELVCQVKFNEWTQDGLLRAPIFLGLKPDVDPRECRRETPVKITQIQKKDPKLPYDFLSNLDKTFWPQQGYTKRDLIWFYHEIADILVPYLKDRPMVLERFPDGFEGKTFYQKDAPEFLPEWIPTVAIESESAEKTIHYILCNDRPALVYLANLACISMHPWSSRVKTLDNPDFLIIDLDPDEGVPFSDVCNVALKVREITEKLELETYPKTSGATGLHILIPFEPAYSYEDVRTFAEIIARLTAGAMEATATLERNPRKRGGKVYVDYLQNIQGKTIASVYSVRPREGAPVSTPLEWKEVTPSLRPESFHIKNVLQRVERKGDLFQDLLKRKQSLRAAIQRLENLK